MTDLMPNRMTDLMTDPMPDRMPDRMPDLVPERTASPHAESAKPAAPDEALRQAMQPSVHPAVQPALLGFGVVRHTRLRPTHAFDYPTFFLMLPMRSLRAHGWDSLPINRSGWLSFHDADHGDGRGPQDGGALAWLEALLKTEGIADADGEVWLHCYPRVLGYTFKPVSFWHCHRSDGSLRAIVVEVNNTFGERHCYLLDEPRHGHELRARKVFHVSPFCSIEGGYRFRFMTAGGAPAGWPSEGAKVVARIDHDDDSGPLLQTSVSGQLTVVSAASLRRAAWRYPLHTLGVIARIHWQAFKLWRKRVRFHRKPQPPEAFITR